MRESRYDTVAIYLHWTIAVLIAVAFGLGLTVDDFPKSQTGNVINIHSLLGLAVLFLSLTRFLWRLGHKFPAAPAAGGPLLGLMARGVHALLYLLMLAVPLIGIPTLLYRGRGLQLGLFEIAPMLPRTPEIFRPLTEIHEIGAFALVLLALGHVAAALYHQFVLKDGLIHRMAPQAMAARPARRRSF